VERNPSALWKDPALRASLVANAQATVQEPGRFGITTSAAFSSSGGVGGVRFEQRLARLQGLGLPLGRTTAWRRMKTELYDHWAGWLITALAIWLGAPFWFDTLNRVMSIRAAGKSPEEKPKPPKEEPKVLGPGETSREARQRDDDRRDSHA
jgi:hypothetical protein